MSDIYVCAKELTAKLLDLISNVVGYTVNIQKSFAFLYTSNKQVESEIKNTVLFTLASPQNEVFRCKSNKIYKRGKL